MIRAMPGMCDFPWETIRIVCPDSRLMVGKSSGTMPGPVVASPRQCNDFFAHAHRYWFRREGTAMAGQEHIGYAAAVAGGAGLGLLLGSEFPGTSTTLLGAALALIAIAAIAMLSFRRP